MAANNKLIILVFLICRLPHIIITSASAQDVHTKADVDSLCRATPYPNQCLSSLTPYVQSRAIGNPELVQLLLKDALDVANDTKDFVLKEVGKLSTGGLYMLYGISDSLTQILSIPRVGEGVDAMYRNNLERWTSAALTDAERLVSKFQGRRRLSKLESKIYGKVKNVEETTSNALAILQHHAAARH